MGDRARGRESHCTGRDGEGARVKVRVERGARIGRWGRVQSRESRVTTDSG